MLIVEWDGGEAKTGHTEQGAESEQEKKEKLHGIMWCEMKWLHGNKNQERWKKNVII